MALRAFFAGTVGVGIMWIMFRAYQLRLDKTAAEAGSSTLNSDGYAATTEGLEAFSWALAQSPWLALIAVLAAVLVVGKALT